MKRQVDYNGFYENILKNSFNAPFQLNSDIVLENVSKIPEYEPIINFLKRLWSENAFNYKSQGLFLSDYPLTKNIYFGYLDEVVNSEDEKSLLIPFYYYTDIGRLSSYDISYDLITDILTIKTTVQEKVFLTNNNVKSVFNQSITGTGNITLYMHYIAISDASNQWYFQFISSNNLKVDSLQDLTTLINPTNNINLYIPCVDENSFSSALLSYFKNVWTVNYQDGSSNITSVKDVVKPI